ncbi:MAG: class I SAM-dependent methyltransferase [Chloroflexi bacterium]|nr:class I SAM-dependent methyltransferase [Chloroflexota bacterium]
MTITGLAWQRNVELEHEQSDRIREEAASDDFWKPVAQRFVPPEKGDSGPDNTVEQLKEFIEPKDTVLDVGAGGGRLAIPLAEYCVQVTAVEPSQAMRERLIATARVWDVENVSVLSDRWEDIEVAPHDLVVCAHVVYTATHIEHFIAKLTSHARKTVALISFETPATSNYVPLWKLVHGEDRITLPTLPNIEELLSEMAIWYRKTPLESWISRPFVSRDQAISECESRLFITPGSRKSEMLADALDDSLVEVDGGYRLGWAEPHRPWIISWNA